MLEAELPSERLARALFGFNAGVELGQVATVLALMAALAFRERFRGRGVVFYLLLLGMVTPGIIVGLGFRLFADQIGLPTGWKTTGLLTHIAWTMPFGVLNETRKSRRERTPSVIDSPP